MEEIIKKITLTDFKNYNPNVSVKCLGLDDSFECWNEIPMDLIVTNEYVKNTLPIVKKVDEDGNEYFVLRYYNIKKLFLFFEEYERSMVYYRLIEVKNKKRWSKCKKPTSFTVFTSLPSVEEFECGTYIATNILHEQYLKYTGGGNKRIETAIKEIFDKYFTNDTSLTYDTPYINIPLYVSTDITDCGEMLNTLQKWTPLKQYYKGDIVFYENEYYVAKNDVSSSKFINNDWELLNLKTPSGVKTDEKEVYSESRLNYFLPQRKTYDIKGNQMSFIYDDATQRGFLLYKQGYTNYVEKDEGVFVDYLEKIEKYTTTDGWSVLTPDSGITNDVEEGKQLTTTKGLYKIFSPRTQDYVSLDSEWSDVEMLKFTYIIDGQVDSENELIQNSGVKYEEVRKCYVNKIKTDITNEGEKTYEYIEIEPLSEFSKEKEFKVSYAKILNVSVADRFKNWEQGTIYFYNEVVFDYLTDSYYRCIVKGVMGTTDGLDKKSSWQLLNFSHLYVDDRLFGTSYVDVDLPKIPIDRGNYTAMERHYVLGEVNSFDDLEKYRNNLFKL